MTEYYLESVPALRRLEPFMKQMEKEGSWKILSREVEENTLSDKSGVFHTIRKSLR